MNLGIRVLFDYEGEDVIQIDDSWIVDVVIVNWCYDDDWMFCWWFIPWLHRVYDVGCHVANKWVIRCCVELKLC